MEAFGGYSAVGGGSSFFELVGGFPAASSVSDAPHGTTILAAGYRDGVVMVGDRRATVGNQIALHDVEKVFGADERSIIGVAGVAGPAVEFVKLFQVELEHFEKVEGLPLSFDGKANRLSSMLRASLADALQGLVVLPLFVGWDDEQRRGRIFSYDATGGRYEEESFAAVGSGASYAKSALKKLHDPDADELTAVTCALQALFDAADDDAATSGLDLTRGILPVVMRASAAGVVRWSEAGVDEVARRVVEQRSVRFGGPRGAAL